MTSTFGATKNTTICLRSQKAPLFGTTPYFLPFLLAPLLRQPCFHFGSFRIVDLAISRTESRDRKVAIGFSEYSL